MKAGIPTDGGASRPAIPSPGGAEELSRRWRIGKPQSLEEFLADWTSAHSATALSARELGELAGIDQRERWRRGERPAAEEYLARFPQLSGDEEFALDLIYNEFLMREALGEAPARLEYEQRFPQYADTLRDQIEFHQALGANGSGPQSARDTRRTPSTIQHTTGPGARLPAHLTRFVPGYEFLSELGRGGMGIVYQARQLSLNRLVALKVLRAGDCGSPSLLARFQAEAEAVARLHHPHIVQIYDYGERDGMPYLALELVEGSSLAGKLDGTPWPPREAAEVIVTLARAVQFAHEHGIVHRDLKPANVLVGGLETDRVDKGTTVKITDFGLAKVFSEGDDRERNQTQTGTIAGTPSYMAPEQARGQSSLVGPATDVYGLGAILYELVTGQPPFKAATAIETLNQLLNSDPVSPVRHVPRLPRDLVTMVTKCLRKEPGRRYASAAELADDLERFLSDRPILARRASIAERGWRWCRRNPALAFLAGSVAGLLFAVAAVSFVYSVMLSSQLADTVEAKQSEGDARRLAEVRLWDSYLAEIKAGHGSIRVGQRVESLATVDRANELLDSIGRTPDRVLELRSAAIATLARPDLQIVRTMATTPGIWYVDLSVAADRYVTETPSQVSVHRFSNGELLHRISTSTGESESGAVISADGRFVAAIGERGVQIWQCDGEQPRQVLKLAGADQITISPDSRQAAASDPAGGMRLFDLQTGQAVRQLGKGRAQSRFAFHALSRRIAVCTPKSVQIIDWDTGHLLLELLDKDVPTTGVGVAWHPNGELIAVGGLADGVELWDVAAKRLRATCPHRGPIVAPCFSHDGGLLLTLNPWSHQLRAWSVGTGQEVLRDPTFGAFTMDRSAPEGDYLIRIEPSGLALCRLEPGLASNPFPLAIEQSLGDLNGIAISPDGRCVAVGRTVGFELWDLVARRRTSHAGSPCCGVAFDCRGDLLVACQWGLYRWPRRDPPAKANVASASTPKLQFGPPQKLSGPLVDVALGVSADGNVLAVKATAGWQVIRPQSPNNIVNLSVDSEPRKASVSPDGRWVALSNWENKGTIICDSTTGQRVVELPSGWTGQPLFSPDGRWLATTPDGVCLWRVGDWKLATQFHARGTTPSGLGISFSSDSRVLAIAQPHGVTRLTDPVTGANWAEWFRLDSSDGANGTFLTLTPDQSRLIEVGWGAPRILDLAGIRKELSSRGLDWPADVLSIAPESETAARAADLVVTLDEGNLLNQKTAADLTREAGDAKDAKARDLLERAVQLDPDNSRAQNHLAWLLATGPEALRDSPAAVRLARRAVELDQSQATSWNTLGVALYRDGQDQSAIEAFEQSLKRGSDNAAAYDLILLALCHARLGNATAADDFYNRAAAWLEQHGSSISPHWQEELTLFFAEARAAGLPRGN